jgi:hypothetical protein
LFGFSQGIQGHFVFAGIGVELTEQRFPGRPKTAWTNVSEKNVS